MTEGMHLSLPLAPSVCVLLLEQHLHPVRRADGNGPVLPVRPRLGGSHVERQTCPLAGFDHGVNVTDAKLPSEPGFRCVDFQPAAKAELDSVIPDGQKVWVFRTFVRRAQAEPNIEVALGIGIFDVDDRQQLSY